MTGFFEAEKSSRFRVYAGSCVFLVECLGTGVRALTW